MLPSSPQHHMLKGPYITTRSECVSKSALPWELVTSQVGVSTQYDGQISLLGSTVQSTQQVAQYFLFLRQSNRLSTVCQWSNGWLCSFSGVPSIWCIGQLNERQTPPLVGSDSPAYARDGMVCTLVSLGTAVHLQRKHFGNTAWSRTIK